MKFESGFLDQVKSAVDIVRVVSEYVRLRKSGANYIGLCPFHTEKTPSFHIHQARQFFRCFGCDAAGDVFTFVQTIERITFPEALKFLAERYGIPLPKANLDGELDQTAKERLALLEVNQKATKVFKHQLAHSGEGKLALNYLRERGLKPETIERFDIGYSLSYSDTLFRKLSEDFSLDILLKSGLIQKSNYDSHHYDRFRNRVVFPICNESGKTIAFGGRIIGDGQPKYLNSPETTLYSKSKTLYALSQARESIRRKRFAILVEGYMDCLALHQSGVNNAVASCGTSLTESQAKLLSRFADRIVTNFDPDSAGLAATFRSLNILLETGFKIKVLALPGGNDPDAFVKKNGIAAYVELLESAPTYFEYLMKKAQEASDLATVEGKVEAVNTVLPYLAQISDRIERAEQTRRLSEVFRIEESAIREALQSTMIEKRKKLPSQLPKSQLKQSEKYLLKTIFESEPAVSAEIIQHLAISEDYVGLQSEGIFHEIVTLYKKEGKIDLSVLQGSLQNDRDRDFLSQALFAEVDQLQALQFLEGIRRQKAEREIAHLQLKIKEAETSQDFELLSTLHSKKTELKRMIAS